MSKFSENLKMLRKRNHYSQTQLAEKIGVGRSAISMWEIGDREPDFETLEALADIFNVDMDFLTGRKAEKSPTTNGEGLVNDDPELTEYLQELQSRPEMKMLFHTFKTATKEQIEAIVTAWDARNNVKGE